MFQEEGGVIGVFRGEIKRDVRVGHEDDNIGHMFKEDG